jgi:hypothetical protein
MAHLKKKLIHCDEDKNHDEGTVIARTSELKKKFAVAPKPSIAILGEKYSYWETDLC